MAKTVVILGGGAGGVAAANVLSSTIPPGNRIILVDRKDSHHYQGSYPLLMINRRRPGQVTRRLDRLQKRALNSFRPRLSGYCRCTRGWKPTGEPRLRLPIIALGAEHHPETVPGKLKAPITRGILRGACRLRQKLYRFTRGKIVLFISSLPLAAPAPYEIMFLLDDFSAAGASAARWS